MLLAGHLKLKNLIVLYDSNKITASDGSRELSDSENVATRFKAYGWHTQAIDGHNFAGTRAALHTANEMNDRPCLIICRTTIALGAPTKANTCYAHGAPLGKLEVKLTKKNYGWPENESFFIPEDLLAIWRDKIGSRFAQNYTNWKKAVDRLVDSQKAIFSAKSINETQIESVISHLKEGYKANQAEATRESSGKVLAALINFLPFIGGSADLTESNYTKVATMTTITAENFNGNYIHYGIREHAMGAIMNGIALYGRFIPYGGGFLVFMDYAKPALRMAALMGLQVIYIMTHDSIGVGEDGPTHQPIEQLAYLRSIPNVKVFRPADGIETAECWELALKNQSGPSVLCLTRQKVPQIRTNSTPEISKDGFCACGAYILSEGFDIPHVTIFATGSEVAVALAAQKELHEQNISTRVVSVPCFEIFDQQDDQYKASILGNDSIKIAVEAAIRFGWDKYIGHNGIFVGMEKFGVSAPSSQLFNFFNITAENVTKLALIAKKTIQLQVLS